MMITITAALLTMAGVYGLWWCARSDHHPQFVSQMIVVSLGTMVTGVFLFGLVIGWISK